MTIRTFTKEELFSESRQASTFFSEYGFLHLKKFYDSDLCEECINSIAGIEKGFQGELINNINLVTEAINGKTFVKYFQGIFSLGTIYRKFLNLDLLSIGSLLLATKDVFFADLEAHIRNPGGGEIPKHQDNFYFNLKASSGITAYIALSPHGKLSGGLNYKISSHKQVIPHVFSDVKGFSSYLTESKINNDLGVIGTYSPVYEVGDLTIHHCNNIHWSDPCPTESLRGYALSARIFDSHDSIDPKGAERYRKLLSQNRSDP